MRDFFFFKQKTAYEMRMSDWSSDVFSADLEVEFRPVRKIGAERVERAGACRAALHHDLRQARLELRLGKDAARAERGDLGLNLAQALGAGLVLRVHRERADREIGRAHV